MSNSGRRKGNRTQMHIKTCVVTQKIRVLTWHACTHAHMHARSYQCSTGNDSCRKSTNKSTNVNVVLAIIVRAAGPVIVSTLHGPHLSSIGEKNNYPALEPLATHSYVRTRANRPYPIPQHTMAASTWQVQGKPRHAHVAVRKDTTSVTAKDANTTADTANTTSDEWLLPDASPLPSGRSYTPQKVTTMEATTSITLEMQQRLFTTATAIRPSVVRHFLGPLFLKKKCHCDTARPLPKKSPC
jgi:hypothetical protein